ncbi:MAG: four helix bundle protein [Flavobacteriales bacterium]|nr:four helix bundle protein [Flavobacteriales bacterium]
MSSIKLKVSRVKENKGTFEDLKVWQKSRELNSLIYNLGTFENHIKDYAFVDQLRRACLSISTNIAEGYERQTTKELIRFLFIARGSAGEVRSLLYVAKDLNYINENTFDGILENVTEVSKMIYGFIKYLESI